jgi:hypothetical protein
MLYYLEHRVAIWLGKEEIRTLQRYPNLWDELDLRIYKNYIIK